MGTREWPINEEDKYCENVETFARTKAETKNLGDLKIQKKKIFPMLTAISLMLYYLTTVVKYLKSDTTQSSISFLLLVEDEIIPALFV